MNKRQCFVASPIGEEGSDTRRKADQVLKYIINAALIPMNFEVTRADKISEPGLITSQMVNRLLNDDLVVADLTDSNANVFYEVAIRQAAQRPIVMLIRKGQRIPFDLAGFRTIGYDTTDPDSVADAKDELGRQAFIEVDKLPEQIESPIGLANQLNKLRHSSKGESQYLAQLVEEVAGLRNRLTDIDTKMTHELSRLTTPVSRSFALAVDFEKSLDRILDYAQFDANNSAKSKRHYQELLDSVLDDLTHLRAKVRSSAG